ncbi:MAG: polysaccharide biosynthesis/export family protein, partial [Desulfovibrio sp.]|nr:polysaccharide biosynthesis/export family protein [Desulfovibrio sp.]
MIRTLFPALLLPLLLCAGAACAADEPQPYAANLFQGNFSQSAASGDKNAAVIAPGDRVVLRLWGGGLKVDDTLVVSPDGRLDVPEVGVIPVAGLGYDTLTEALRSKLAALLLEHRREDGFLTLAMNRGQMADFLGVTRPSLSRELAA